MPQQTSSAILGITSLLMNVANPQAYLVDPRAPIGNYGSIETRVPLLWSLG